MTHKIKLYKEFADDVLNGEKSFEVRFNDRGYQKGDYIEFKVIDGPYEIDHPLNDKRFIITYVLTGWGIQENYCVLAIKETNNAI